jgi:hypothetical protein
MTCQKESEAFRLLLYRYGKLSNQWNSDDETCSVPVKPKTSSVPAKEQIPKVEVVQVDVNVDNPDTNLSFPSST